MSSGGMLLTSRNNTERGRKKVHLPSLQALITFRKAFVSGGLQSPVEKVISKSHPHFLKPVQLWVEAFLKDLVHLIDQDTLGANPGGD